MDDRTLWCCLVVGVLGCGAPELSTPTPAPDVHPHAIAPEKIHELSADAVNLGSNPAGYATLGANELFFTRQGVLYSTDGTTVTVLHDPGLPVPATSEPPTLAVLGGFAYWIRDSELWKTDGTIASTSRVFAWADTILLTPGFQNVVVMNGALYFSAITLYRSDGTAAGTQQLGARVTGPQLQVTDARVHFVCDGLTSTTEPCSSDGTIAGTVSSRNVNAYNLRPRFLGALGRRALFAAEEAPDNPARGLWITNGTQAGTIQLNRGAFGIAEDAPPVAVLGSNAYVPCSSEATGPELCKTDGTAAGTTVLDLVPGAAGLDPKSPVVLGGRIVFAGTTAAGGTELWSTDGTVAGTHQIVDLLPGTGSGYAAGKLVAVGATAYFAGHATAAAANELWKTDGTAAGTVRVAATQRIGIPEKTPLALGETAVFGGRLLFAADDGVTGLEPWITDGTAAGTHLLVDALTTRTQAEIHGFTSHLGATYIGTQAQLWKSDGTAAGTASVQDGVEPIQLTSAATSLFFFDLAQRTLWKTDGTPGGGQSLAAMYQIGAPTSLGNRIVFRADDPAGMPRTDNAWISDGTVAGTHRIEPPLADTFNIRNINGRLWIDGSPAPGESSIYLSDAAATSFTSLGYIGREFTPVGDTVVFCGVDLEHGLAVWRSDGTHEGTARIDLGPRTAPAGPRAFFPWKTKHLALFLGVTPDAPVGLWRTDGTPTGTTLIKQVGAAFPPTYVEWGDHVFFLGSDDEHGAELWRTDGTPEGTAMVADLYPGLASSQPGLFTLAGPDGPLVFVAETPETGRELWQITDPEGAPSLLADLAPGARSSSPAALTMQGTALLVAADAGTGYALWKLAGVGTDRDPPELTCPLDVGAIGDGPRTVEFPPPTATDASGALTIVIDHPSGSVFPLGETVVHVVATDVVENTSSCTFIVRVQPDGTGAGGAGGDGDNGHQDDGGGCSTGGAPGLLILAAAALLRRRRRSSHCE